jgi:hypothetical protein
MIDLNAILPRLPETVRRLFAQGIGLLGAAETPRRLARRPGVSFFVAPYTAAALAAIFQPAGEFAKPPKTKSS